MLKELPEGAKVFIKHHRYTTVAGKYGVMLPAKDIREEGLPFESKGGMTEAFITLPDGREVAAYAICSDKDNFNRTIGRNIAVGRAIKALGL